MTLPREDPEVPIVPGARWCSRGTSGHQRTEYTVLKFNGRSVFVIHEGPAGRHKSGKRYAIPEPAFRNNHVLVKQPPGWAPGDVVVDTSDDLIARVTGTRPEDLYSPASLRMDPIPPEQGPEVLEALGPLRRADPVEEEPPVIEDTTTFVPAVLAEAVLNPTPPEGEGREAPDESDPIEEFLQSGERLIARLGAEMAELAGERDRLLVQAEQADARCQEKAAQLDRIRAAVEGARAAGVTPDPHPPSPPREAKPPLQNTQRAWVLGRLTQQRTLIVADIVAPFGEAFKLDRETARKNISSILVEQMRRPVAPWATPIRIDKGTYAAQPGTGA